MLLKITNGNYEKKIIAFKQLPSTTRESLIKVLQGFIANSNPQAYQGIDFWQKLKPAVYLDPRQFDKLKQLEITFDGETLIPVMDENCRLMLLSSDCWVRHLAEAFCVILAKKGDVSFRGIVEHFGHTFEIIPYKELGEADKSREITSFGIAGMEDREGGIHQVWFSILKPIP